MPATGNNLPPIQIKLATGRGKLFSNIGSLLVERKISQDSEILLRNTDENALESSAAQMRRAGNFRVKSLI